MTTDPATPDGPYNPMDIAVPLVGLLDEWVALHAAESTEPPTVSQVAVAAMTAGVMIAARDIGRVPAIFQMRSLLDNLEEQLTGSVSTKTVQ